MLEEVAKLWKAEGGGVIVEDGEKMKAILKTLEGSMSGGRIGLVRTNSHLSRQSSFAFGQDNAHDAGQRPSLEGRHSSFGMSKLQVEEPHANDNGYHDEDDNDDSSSKDPRAWLKVISAFDQPRFTYDPDAKHFHLLTTPTPSLFPSASHKTTTFRTRYNTIHQRLLRNEAFQSPSFSTQHTFPPSRKKTTNNHSAAHFYKLTPISNLLGRGGTSHLLLALLAIAPTGTPCLHDPSGSITLDLAHASPAQESYFCPGMIVLVDGVYDDEWAGAGSAGLGGTGGVGGMIGGRFVGFSIACPPVERRGVSLGFDLKVGDAGGGGFGWTDFLGLGSERAVGGRMRRVERRVFCGDEARRKMVVLGEVTLDEPLTLLALRKLLSLYSASSSDEEKHPPMAFLLCGNFSSRPALAGSGTGSIEYKELFDALAAILADFPTLLRRCTWIFVPGDNDAWSSAFSAGASTMLPRERVPEVFTRRVMRVFASARAEPGVRKAEGEVEGEVVWTSNPARVSLFGPAHEVVVFRDDVEGRLRRNAVRVGQLAKHGDGDATPAPQQDGNQSASGGQEDVVMSGALPLTETDPEIAEAMTVGSPAPETPHQPLQALPSGEKEEEDYATLQAKKLILTLLPQSTLSPFPATVRPVHWDYATSALSLYPLPHTLVLADAEAKAFALTYEGCHVMNPGRFVTGAGRGARVGWVEYDCFSKRGVVRGMRVE